MAVGYLANLLNVPPLIFRFQFNPDMLQEKRTYKYKEANAFGNWDFSRAKAADGAFATLGGLYEDVKQFGSLLVATKALEAEEGEPRTIALEFTLDATVPTDLNGRLNRDNRNLDVRRNLAPELATLRSFVNPSWDLIDVGKFLYKGEVGCWSKPPECQFGFGGLSLTCVMTDLNLKMVSFFSDATPSRVEVNATLREQTNSASTVIDFLARNYYALGYQNDTDKSGPALSGTQALGPVLEDMFT